MSKRIFISMYNPDPNARLMNRPAWETPREYELRIATERAKAAEDALATYKEEVREAQEKRALRGIDIPNGVF